MHNHLGHRHNSFILLAHQNNIWNNVVVKPDPESISETCQSMLSRRTNRNHDHPADYPTDPGRMVMTDFISNPFPSGLTSKLHFLYYLLIVDVVSHFPTSLAIFPSLSDFGTLTPIRCSMRCANIALISNPTRIRMPTPTSIFPHSTM
jgi:hypothetical protein